MRIRIPDKFNTALAVVLMTLVCLSCSDRHDPPVPGPDLQTTFEPATCAVPVYRSPEIGGDMQGVIETCFPMRGELGQARIAVFSEADVLNDPNKINRH